MRKAEDLAGAQVAVRLLGQLFVGGHIQESHRYTWQARRACLT